MRPPFSTPFANGLRVARPFVFWVSARTGCGTRSLLSAKTYRKASVGLAVPASTYSINSETGQPKNRHNASRLSVVVLKGFGPAIRESVVR
jgi:hypothetical protein